MFNLTFTAKRKLQRFGIVSLILIMVFVLVWFCWVIWLERYVVYSRDGATINMNLPDYVGQGQLAAPPAADETIPIYINEGSDTINLNTELTKINGYYIDTDTLQNDMEATRNVLATLPAETAVMVELKNIWGTFYYSSKVEGATLSTKLDPTTVDALITDITSKNLYAVAMIPAFRERYYCLDHTSAGLEVSKRTHLWQDDEKCYWLDPTDNGALNWVMQIVEELKALGFDEVVFTEFRMPDTNGIYFSGDREAAIANAANTIVQSCATENFAVSFLTSDTQFKLPEGGRCRIYLKDIGAKDVAAAVARMAVPDPLVNLVFIANTNDTRYDEYSSFRPIVTLTEN